MPHRIVSAHHLVGDSQVWLHREKKRAHVAYITLAAMAEGLGYCQQSEKGRKYCLQWKTV